MPVIVSGSAGETVISGSGVLVSGSTGGNDMGVPSDKTLIQLASGSVTFNIGDVAGSDFKVINAGGASVLHVEGDTNRVGIGTNAPTQMLHLSGTAGDVRILLEGFPARTNYVAIQNHDNLVIAADDDDEGADSEIRFRIDGTQYAVLTGGDYNTAVGALGLGTTTPTAKFNVETTGATTVHISRDGSATSFTSANWNLGTIGFGGQDSDSGIDNDAAMIAVKTDSAWAAGSHATYMALSTTATGSVAATERMRINSSGNVGIGITAPESLLHVHTGDPGVAPHAGAKDFVVESDGTVGMSILGGAANSARIYFGSSGGNRDGKIDYNLSDDIMQFGTADATRMVIDSAGHVGIGVTDPDSTLEVYNAAAPDGQQLKLSYDATNFAAFRVDSTGDLHVTSSGGDSTFSVASSLRVNRLGDCMLEIDSGYGRNGNRRFQFQSDTAASNGQLSIGSVSNPDTMIVKGNPAIVGIGGVSGWTPNAILHLSASHTNHGGPILQTDSAGAGVIFSVTGSTTLGAGKVIVTGSFETQHSTGNATGTGFDGVSGSPVIKTQKINNEITTTIIVDIGGLQFPDADGEVIGDDGEAHAYILKLDNDVNGIIYKAEIGCVETVAHAMAGEVLLVTNPGDLTQGADALAAGITWIDPLTAWKAGMWAQSTVLQDYSAAEEDYLYLAIGSNVGGAGAFSAGKFVIKLYGASF